MKHLLFAIILSASFAGNAFAQALAPTITKSFNPSSVLLNGDSDATITVTNPNAFPIVNVSFSDTMPAGVDLITQVGGTCSTLATGGGSFSINPGTETFSSTSSVLTGGQSCTIIVRTRGIAVGAHVNTTSQVTATATPNGGPASATLTVTAVCSGSLSATPATLGYATVGNAFTQLFTMTNGAAPATFGMTGTLPNGMSFTTATLSGTPTQRGAFPVTLSVTDNNGCSASVNYTVLVRRDRPFAVGAGAGGTPLANTYTGVAATARTSGFAYATNFTGGVSVAMGDTNGDGVVDLITGAGPGGAPHVKVYSGMDSSLLLSFFAYDPAMTAGVEVAAGDVDADGFADVITAPGPGGQPAIRMFDGRSGVQISEIALTQTGVHIAAADVTGDSVAELIVGAGPGNAPVVQIMNGATGTTLRQFMPYHSGFLGGVYVAAGDFNGDGRADIVTGAGPGGGPHVRIFDGVTGDQLTSTPIDNFFPYDGSFAGGVRVAAGDLNGDDRAELITAPGAGGGATIKIYDGATGTLTTTFEAFAGASGGAFVAAPGPLNRMLVDIPQRGASVTSPFPVAGWIVEEQAALDAGADVVHVWAFPVGGGTAQFVGAGAVSVSRVDIASYFGGDFLRSGFSVTATLPIGQYDLVVYVHNATTGMFDQVRVVRVTVL